MSIKVGWQRYLISRSTFSSALSNADLSFAGCRTYNILIDYDRREHKAWLTLFVRIEDFLLLVYVNEY